MALNKTRYREFVPNRLVDVLKMDVEGAEYGVLRDMIKHNVKPKQIAFESHWWATEVAHAILSFELFSALRRLGYRRVAVDAQPDPTCFEWTVINDA